MTYIDLWYNKMLAYKWEKALSNDPLFKNLNLLKRELELFFSPSDFRLDSKIDPENWLIHILANHAPNSINIINEIAQLLKYNRNLPQERQYQFSNNDGRMNYKALQETLYELYINYLIQSAGLKPQTGEYYCDKKGHKKPMDVLTSICEEKYNIEVTKFYDGFKEELITFSTDLLSVIHQILAKRKIYQHEMFSGYYAFKRREENIIRKEKPLFGQHIKKLLHGFRGQPDAAIRFQKKIENNDYLFDLEPAFNNNYENNYDDLLKSFPGSIRFRITTDLKTNLCHAEVKTECTENIADANKRLQNKIKSKLAQHKDCPYKLLIVIGIEQMFSSHSKNRALPIHKRDVDEIGIHQVIHEKAIVWLIFKELQPNGMHYNLMVLGNLQHHKEMLAVLNNVNPAVIYKPE